MNVHVQRNIFTEKQRWLGRLSIIFLVLSIALGVVIGMGVVLSGQPGVVLILLLGVIIFAGAVLSVEFGLLILVLLAYTRTSDILVQYYSAPSVAKLFIPLLIVAILVRWALNHQPPRGWEKPAILLGIYGMVGFGSLIYAPDPYRVQDALIVFVKDAIIVLVVVVLLQTARNFKRVVWTLILIGIFLGSLSLFQYVTKTYNDNYLGFAQANIQSITGERSDYRSAGPIGDPNYYAQIMVVLLPIALERLLHEQKPLLRGLAAWGVVVIVFAIFLTYSRGGFLAMSVSLLAFLMVYPPKIAYIPIAIMGGLLLLSLAPPNYLDRILSLNELFTSDGSRMVNDPALRGRASENLAALAMVKAHPLFGIGLSNFSYLFNQYSKEAGLALVATERAAHNLYLEVVAETGLVGLATFLIILATCIRTIAHCWWVFVKTKYREYAGMIAAFGMGFLGYLVAAFFIHGAYPRYFYLLIGIALSLHLVAQNHQEELRSTPKNERVSAGVTGD